MNPRHPVYIVSKGRWKTRLTSRALEHMGVPYLMVVEPQEFQEYAAVIDSGRLIVLPEGNHGEGPTIARNFAWEHAIAAGATHHWVLDDNLDAFHRLNRNIKAEVDSGTIFRCAEDFVERYANVPLAGFNYYGFCKTTDSVPPFVLNTRIYSCLFIQNDLEYRWRGRYNEDTDLSLRVLKSGRCTIQFNAFLCGKVTTQRMKGGNTAEFYEREGTLAKSALLAETHPDVSKVVWRFNRWHHHVNYKPFKKNKLVLKNGVEIPQGVNNYGMALTSIAPTQEAS